MIPCRRSTAVHFQSVERRVQRNLEGLANARLDELTVVRPRDTDFFFFNYRKRGSASYNIIVREVHSVRERERERYREREREREKDGSDVTIVTLKLAMSFALLLAKNVHLSIGDEFCAFPCQKICTSVFPLLNGAEFTLKFPFPKTLHFSKRFAFFALSNGVIDRGSKQQSKRSNFRLHRSSFSSKKSKK